MNMTLDEFDKLTQDIVGYHNYREGYVYVTWDVGGERSNGYDEVFCIEPEDEPEFADMDMVLERVAPAITCLQYRSVRREVVERGQVYSSDYYSSRNEAYKKYLKHY